MLALLCLFPALGACAAEGVEADGGGGHSVPVIRVEERNGAYALTMDGAPYFVEGVGGRSDAAAMDLLIAKGANSVRTWGVGEGTRELLDRAHANGVTVTLGLWLAHPGKDFDYSNPEHLAGQTEQVREAVEKYRDHPAVLVWGLGNEMENGADDMAAVYRHVEALTQMVKELDPHQRPVMTVTAEVGGDKIPMLHQFAPSIDIVGINSYAGAGSVAKRYREIGGTKPYIITEFGPFGPWEVGKTEFGAAVEPTSTQKVDHYKTAYENAVLAERGKLCLGSYAFLWGHKQESTTTWFGLFRPFVPEGEPIQTATSVDLLQQYWTGKRPANRAPSIEPLELPGDQLKPGQVVAVQTVSEDPDGDALNWHWEVRGDTLETITWGVARPTDVLLEGAVQADPERDGVARLTAPDEPGTYRLYVFTDDGQGHFATANAAFQVIGR